MPEEKSADRLAGEAFAWSEAAKMVQAEAEKHRNEAAGWARQDEGGRANVCAAKAAALDTIAWPLWTVAGHAERAAAVRRRLDERSKVEPEG